VKFEFGWSYDLALEVFALCALSFFSKAMRAGAPFTSGTIPDTLLGFLRSLNGLNFGGAVP